MGYVERMAKRLSEEVRALEQRNATLETVIQDRDQQLQAAWSQIEALGGEVPGPRGAVKELHGDEVCGACNRCLPPELKAPIRMVVCRKCGNKRCPHANDHANECTGSNEPGQPGSDWPPTDHPGGVT